MANRCAQAQSLPGAGLPPADSSLAPPRCPAQEIHAKIMSLRFEDCKVYISNVDSQSSAEGGIIVQVIGEMSNANGPWRKFAQTFFLAGQHNGYFVLNDICRYIKEEGDEILDAPAAAPAQAEVSADTPVSLPPAASVESVLFEDKSTSQQQVPETEPAAQAGPSAETEQQASADNSFTFHSEALNAAQSPEASQEKEAEGTKEQEAPESEAPQADEAKEPAPAAAGEPPVADRAEAAPAATAAVAAEQRSDEAKPSPAATAEAAAAPTVPAVPATETPAAPPSSTAAPTSPAPAAPATPAAPAAPKSWASLAASNSTKWGKVSSENKGVSATTSAVRPAFPQHNRARTAADAFFAIPDRLSCRAPACSGRCCGFDPETGAAVQRSCPRRQDPVVLRQGCRRAGDGPAPAGHPDVSLRTPEGDGHCPQRKWLI